MYNGNFLFKNSKIIQGDALIKLSELSDNSIDFVCSDLPFGKTKNKWDKIIPPNDYIDFEIKQGKFKRMVFDEFALYMHTIGKGNSIKDVWDMQHKRGLWSNVWRVIKPNGAVLFFGQDKFTAMMMLSDPNHRYNIIYEKTTTTGFFNAKKMPLRSHEDMMIFYKNLPTYNPQKTTGHPRKVSKARHKINCKKTTNYGEHGFTDYDSTERYPRSVWKFKTDKQKSTLHSTQKPVKLIEECILTFSNEGDTVLDLCSGSGTTAEACFNTNRDFIIIEKNPVYFEKGKKRICDIFDKNGLDNKSLFNG